VLAAVGLLLASPRGAVAGGGKFLWQSREQFVAIEKPDGDGAEAIANDHPAALPADQLRGMLDALKTVEPGKEQPLPVFNEQEREILVEFIREGLSLAGPHEDVTFAVIGQFPTLLGFAKERKVTTGRVFFQRGELNLIFGMVHRDVKDNEDRRLSPFSPGSRSRPADLAGRIEASQQHAFIMKRGDWLVFSPAGMDQRTGTPAKKPAQVEQGLPAAEPSGKERGKPARVEKRGRSVEDRLRLLNELRDKKLITEEEYRVKRLDILNEL